MISSVQALPYACLSPLLNELQHDSAVNIEDLQFNEDYSFSDLVRRDLVPWVRSWPDDIRAKLQLSLAHEWKFSRKQLRSEIENSDMNALIIGDHLTIWRDLYRDLFDADIDIDSEPISEIVDWDKLMFDPGEPEPFWLLAEHQRRALASQMETIDVEVGGELVGKVRKIILRDVAGIGAHPLNSPRTYAAAEVRMLYEVLDGIVPGFETPESLSQEQIASIRLMRAAALLAQKNDLELKVSAGKPNSKQGISRGS